MCLKRSHSSQSRWPAEKRSQTYRRCDEAGWLSSEKGSVEKKQTKKNVLRSLPKMDFHHKRRSLIICPDELQSVRSPEEVVSLLASCVTRPRHLQVHAVRCAPCAPHCQRADGRRDVKAEKGKDGKGGGIRNERVLPKLRRGYVQWKHSCGPTEALQQRQQNEQMFCLKRRFRASSRAHLILPFQQTIWSHTDFSSWAFVY